MKNIYNRFLHSKIVKLFTGFSVVGVIVTLISMFLTFVFNELLSWNVYLSYVLSYVITIFLSYFFNAIYVFKAKFNLKALVYYYITYLASMILGLIILRFYEWILPTWNHTIISYMVIPFTMLFNFFVVSKFIKNNEE